MDQWEPVLDAAEAAGRGTAPSGNRARLNALFDHLAANVDWAALIPVLRRIITGDHKGQGTAASPDPVVPGWL